MSLTKLRTRVLSMLLVALMVFTLFVGVMPTQAHAAYQQGTLAKGDGPGGTAGNPVSEDEMRQMLEAAYQNVKNYQYSLTGTANPYNPQSNYYFFNCASFVTYVYANYIGKQLGYADVQEAGSGVYVNRGIVPIYPANGAIQQTGAYDKKTTLRNAAYVGSWYEFVESNPEKWGQINNATGMPAEQVLPQLEAGAILFFTSSGSLENIKTAADGSSHIAIYDGNGYIYHCTSSSWTEGGSSRTGVKKEEFSTYLVKLGTAKSLVGWSDVPFVPDKGSIQIEKVDETGNMLPGAEFEIRAVSVDGITSGTLIDTLITDENGSILREDLDVGTYRVIETQAPPNYALGSQTEWIVEVGETTTYPGGYDRLRITNFPATTSLQATKVWADNSDSSGERPATVTFILNDSGTEVSRATLSVGQTGVTVTGNRWYYTFEGLDPDKLQNGDYTIEELEANQGNYTTTVSGYTITNTLTSAPPEPVYNEFYTDRRSAPSFSMPSFSVTMDKQDLEGGSDGNKNTARGEGTLAARYNISWNGTGGVSGFASLTSDEFGSSQSYSFSPWSSISQLTRTVYTTQNICGFSGVLTSVAYTGTVTVRVEEITPEGYLDEQKSGSGSNYREYTFSYTLRGDASAYCDEDTTYVGINEDTGLEEWVTTHTLYTPWSYTYTYGGTRLQMKKSTRALRTRTAISHFPCLKTAAINSVKSSRLMVTSLTRKSLYLR